MCRFIDSCRNIRHKSHRRNPPCFCQKACKIWGLGGFYSLGKQSERVCFLAFQGSAIDHSAISPD